MVGDTGIEPVYDGIKIRCLTILANPQQFWSGRQGSNLRRTAWKADTLPLSYARTYSGEAYWSRTSVGKSLYVSEHPDAL